MALRTARSIRLKKDEFLAHFRVTGNITASARLAQVTRRTIYDWQEHDAEFLLAFHTAETEATEALEHEAYRRAARGTIKPVFQNGKRVGQIREFSDTLLIFLLKARAPEKYRDRFDANVHTDGPATVIVRGLITPAESAN